MAKTKIKCTSCRSVKNRLNGFSSNGKQRYLCKNCGKVFVEKTVKVIKKKHR